MTFVIVMAFHQIIVVMNDVKRHTYIHNDDYRPVSVLPILFKVYERLVCKQFVKYIEEQKVLKDTMSGFRPNHSTQTLLLKIRDDIKKV